MASSGEEGDEYDDFIAQAPSTDSTGTTTSTFGDGELEVLLHSLDEPSAPLSVSVRKSLRRNFSGNLTSESGESIYGHPLSEAEADARMPSGTAGMIYHATVIPDQYFINGKLRGGLAKGDFDLEAQGIKPRRSSLPITCSDLFSSMTRIHGPAAAADGNKNKLAPVRHVFYGVLNGWPSLRCFELVSLERKRQSSGMIPSPKDVIMGHTKWTTIWTAAKDGKNGLEPHVAILAAGAASGSGGHAANTDQSVVVYRAKLRGAPWTAKGWTKDSPGFCFWFEPHHAKGPQFSHGTNMLQALSYETKCTNIHMFSHRYAVTNESPRDFLTYHSVCLLEWDNGQNCTVVEMAFLNGMGGYKGKCNWYEDRDVPTGTLLYQMLPPLMVAPWCATRAEVRCYDIEAKTVDQFLVYVDKYKGNDQRFVDPQLSFSHSARLTFRSRAHIAQYLLNYVNRDSSYAELKRNCQTFASDLCAFVAGKKKVAPFHPVSRIEYTDRTYFFLYDSHMYDKTSSS